MLLQTNSYIVPKEKRTEHTRLMRRFRQTLLRLGCDHFEIYEQVGANWSNTEATARFVQILRFVDRKHQLAVQAAERTDPAAQSVISDFCELINFPYQQEQGLFAVGFYTAALPIVPKRGARGEVVSTVEQEVIDEPEAEMPYQAESDAAPAEEASLVETGLTEPVIEESHEPELAPSAKEPDIHQGSAHEAVVHETPAHDTSFAAEEELSEIFESRAAEPAVPFSGQQMKLVQNDEPFDVGPMKMHPEPEAEFDAIREFRSEPKSNPQPEQFAELQAEPQTEPQPELQADPEELEMLEPEEEEEFSLHSHEGSATEKTEAGHDSFSGALAELDELRGVDHATSGFEPIEESADAGKAQHNSPTHEANLSSDVEEEYYIPHEPVEPIRAYAPAPKLASQDGIEPPKSGFPPHEDQTMTLADGEITEELEERAHGFIASELDGHAGHTHHQNGQATHSENGGANAGQEHQAIRKHDAGNDSSR